MNIDDLIHTLHSEKLSCVIMQSNGTIVKCHRRGVIDLYELLRDTPSVLDGATIADKVVGRGAAALMVLGKVKRLHTDVLSRPALELLQQAGIKVSFTTLADNIINRAGDGICPVEKLTSSAKTAQEALPLIKQFLQEMTTKNH